MAERRKLKDKVPVELVPNWKRAYRWASVQLSALGVLIFGVLEVVQSGIISLPEHILKLIPHGSLLALALSGMTLIGRIYRWKENRHGRK